MCPNIPVPIEVDVVSEVVNKVKEKEADNLRKRTISFNVDGMDVYLELHKPYTKWRVTATIITQREQSIMTSKKFKSYNDAEKYFNVLAIKYMRRKESSK